VLYQLSYILRVNLCLHESSRLRNPRGAEPLWVRSLAVPGAGGPVSGGGGQGLVFGARRAAMIFANDLLRISSSVSPVVSASCSVTAPHAMPRRK
jgi:hypothetical protein